MKKQYRFLTAGALMVMLLTGVMPRAMAQDLNGTDNGKLAEVHDGDRYDLVYGVSDGIADPTTWATDHNAVADGGAVNMDGGTVMNLYGGSAYARASSGHSAAAVNNRVDVSGGTVQSVVFGGVAHGYGAEASGNKVSISGGTLGGEYGVYSVVGGLASSSGEGTVAAANNNEINITGGVLNLGIYGASLEAKNSAGAEAAGNVINIGGDAKISGDVYGAFLWNADGVTNYNLHNNSITVSGSADISGAHLYGSNASSSGNTLTVDGWRGSVQSINNFENINFQNLTWEDNEVIVDIADGAHSNLQNTDIEADHIHFNDGKEINIDDKITLMKADDNALSVDSSHIHSAGFTAGVAVEGDGEAVLENGDVVYHITGLHTAKQTKLVAENRAVAAAFVNQGTDLISDSLDALSRDGSYGVKTFTAVHGNASKYDVNSDIKINGWSTIAGVGNAAQFNSGADFSWGVFYENGSGNYRTYNSFNDRFFRGDGSLVYNGGGVAARYQNAHGVYTEGSLRAGMLKTEMSNALSDGTGKYGYESDAAYYGAHIGAGQLIPLGGGKTLDVYGKFFHTYTEGDSFNVAGDEFSFDAIHSDRLRIGARVSANEADKFSAYYGLAYEYEFNGDAKMRAAGLEAPQQSLKGSSYMAEAGVNYKPSPQSPWSLDLNLRGYAGEREGASVSLQANYSF